MNSEKISISERTLWIDDTQVELKFPIQKTLIFADRLIVLIEPPVGVDVRDNILAFNDDGKRIWTISPVSNEDLDTPPTYVDVYTSNDGDRLLARNWSGATYEVDPSTGEIEYLGWSK